MRVVVTGAHGQLGVDLVRLMRRNGWQVYGFGRGEMDITDQEAVKRQITSIKPDAVVHAAAYTKVDQAELEPEQAYRVNQVGTRHVAKAAEEVSAKLVYVSTDYVFDGQASSPYAEDAETNPINVYGKSKLAGEQEARTHAAKSFIVRTAWVYGRHGNNFVKTMLRLAETQKEVRVVHDQWGSPTFTEDLASFLLDLVQTDRYGIYHATNSGACSWYEFAQAIFAEAGYQVQVIPVMSEEFPRQARRPAYSILDHQAIRRNGFADMRHWREALREYLTEQGR